VKSTSAALAFPFFVVGMIPFRLSFRLIFSKQELDAVSVVDVLDVVVVAYDIVAVVVLVLVSVAVDNL